MHEIYRGVSRPGCIPAYPSCGYFNRGLYETITSSHLELHTKPGRIKGFKLMGVTYQVETTGKQLFDASKIPTTSLGGATVTNNGDGSFTVSGNGTLTSGFSHAIYLEDKDVRRLFRPGEIYMTESPTKTRPYFEVNFFKNDQNVCDLRQTSPFLKATLPDDFFSPENNLRVRYIFYGASGLDIMPGTIKPMMYQDGDGTWESYSESFPSPTPEFPQEIQGVGEKTKNLFDANAWYNFFYSKKQDIYWADDDHTILRWRGSSGYDFPNDKYFEFPIANVPENTWVTLSCDLRKTVISNNAETGIRIVENGDTTKKIFIGALEKDGTDWVHKTISVKISGNLSLMISYYYSEYCEFKNIQLEFSDHETSYEPYGYKTTTRARTEQLLNNYFGTLLLFGSTPTEIVPVTIKPETKYATICANIETPGTYCLSAQDGYFSINRKYLNGAPVEGAMFHLPYVFDVTTPGLIAFSIEQDASETDDTDIPIGAGKLPSDFGFMLNAGSTPQPWQPYGYTEANIYTRSPLTQWDRIEYRNGEYGVARKSAVVVEDGTGGVYDTYYPLLFFDVLAKPMNIKSRVYCNYCPEEHIGKLNINGDHMCINSADTYWGFADAAECKAWLAQKNAEGKPFYYCYETAEETWEPLPAISQAAIRNLKTYKGTTIIDTTDPLEPEITVSYRPQADYSKIPGLEVDYENSIYTRLGGAKNLTAGAQFNRFPMYAGRRRCNVSDDGTITAYVGDPNYREDGSNGQVMVYQPKFWYQVVPLKIEPQKDGLGYHLRRAQYWVSHKPMPGFKLHPAFKKPQELEYIMYSAYEGSIYDTSEAAYILDDAQVMDAATDKFSSIAGAKPASGKTQPLTRQNVEKLAQNRGPGWHGDTIDAESANQLLMMIELGTPNTQAATAQGVVAIPDTPNTENHSIITGGTSSLGNNTGMADGANGKVSVTYRGMENPWGNIWKLVNGVNIYGNGSQKGGVPYICTDYSFEESKNTENYESAGFTLSNTSGYISAMGYSEEFDYLFFSSETVGNSSVTVGDYTYVTANLNGYRIAQLGGSWYYGGAAGAFCWTLSNGVGHRSRLIGGRLIYVPQ